MFLQRNILLQITRINNRLMIPRPDLTNSLSKIELHCPIIEIHSQVVFQSVKLKIPERCLRFFLYLQNPELKGTQNNLISMEVAEK